jgi:hypothetical protein
LAIEIHRHLVQAFGNLAIAAFTVSRDIRMLSWATPDEEARGLGGRASNFMINTRIQQIFMDNPGGSIRQIAIGTGIPTATVLHVLAANLGHIWRRYRLVPHTFSEAQRMERLQRSQMLLITLRRAESTV